MSQLKFKVSLNDHSSYPIRTQLHSLSKLLSRNRCLHLYNHSWSDLHVPQCPSTTAGWWKAANALILPSSILKHACSTSDNSQPITREVVERMERTLITRKVSRTSSRTPQVKEPKTNRRRAWAWKNRCVWRSWKCKRNRLSMRKIRLNTRERSKKISKICWVVRPRREMIWICRSFSRISTLKLSR
jgi:hypothetical protein